MFRMTFILVLLFIALSNLVAAVDQPSNIYFWFPHHRFDEINDNTDNIPKQQEQDKTFTTRTITSNQIDSFVNRHSSDANIIVFVDSYSNKVKDKLKHSISHNSRKFEVLSSVYTDENSKKLPSHAILENDIIKTAESTSIKNVFEHIQNNKNSNNKDSKKQVYRTQIKADSDITTLDSIAKLGSSKSNSNVLFIMVEEGKKPSFAPKEESKLLTQEYEEQETRRLASSSSSSSSSSKHNQGLSIWYDEDHLYITPDIFTAIMTSLFLTAGAFIGLTCLGAIQGPKSFVDRSPTVGREA